MATGNDDHGIDPAAGDPGDPNGAAGAGNPNPGGAADPGKGGAPAAADLNRGIDPDGNPGGDQQLGGAGGDPAGDIYKPEGIKTELVGKTDRETIDNLLAENKGFREAQSKGLPKTVDEYKWNWGDKVKGKGTIADDDALVKEFGTIAHEHGFSQKHLDAIPAFFDKLAEKGMLDSGYDPNAVLEGLAPAGFQGSAADKQAEGAKVMNQTTAWIDQLDGQAYSDEMKQEMKLLTTSVPGMKVLSAFMKAGSNPSVSAGGKGADPGITRADLDRRVADPRNDPFDGEKFDPHFAQETDELFKKFYG